VARELTNPNNGIARLTITNQYRWYIGDLPNADEQSNCSLLFQPVFPFSLGTNESGDKIPVNGNALNDVAIRGDNGENIPLFMKDSKLCKNAIK